MVPYQKFVVTRVGYLFPRRGWTDCVCGKFHEISEMDRRIEDEVYLMVENYFNANVIDPFQVQIF